MWEEFLKIPKNRILALIGKEGEIKSCLEKIMNCKINVSSEGEVELFSEDSFGLLKAKNIVKAIGRGFDPDESLVLLDDEFILHIVNLHECLGKGDKIVRRSRRKPYYCAPKNLNPMFSMG